MPRFTPVSDTARQFRDALGRFATGVTLVAAQSARGPVGITANSFAAVSLDPALVLWSPARSSSRFAIFAAAEHFTIHVLGADQRDLAARFTRNGYDFSGLTLTEGPGRAPVIDDCLSHFTCRRAAAHDGGDHLVIVGEVLEAGFREGAPLVFSQGFYGGFSSHD